MSSMKKAGYKQSLPLLRVCVGPWQKGWHPWTPEKQWTAWAEVSEVILSENLQRKNDVVAEIIWSFKGENRRCGLPKKVLDKKRWSQSAHLSATTARNAGRFKVLSDCDFL